ncbi:hypothetical protein D3C81_1299860 [compost metagenome]
MLLIQQDQTMHLSREADPPDIFARHLRLGNESVKGLGCLGHPQLGILLTIA